MQYIYNMIAILGVTSVLGAIPAVVLAQAPQIHGQQMDFQEYLVGGCKNLNKVTLTEQLQILIL